MLHNLETRARHPPRPRMMLTFRCGKSRATRRKEMQYDQSLGAIGFLVAVSITLVWMFCSEQNAFERLNSTQLRQPASMPAGGEVKQNS